MCQMCEEYEAELRRHGMEPEPSERERRHRPQVTAPTSTPREKPEPAAADDRRE